MHVYIHKNKYMIINYFILIQDGKDGYDFRDGYDLNIKDNGTYSTYLYTQRAEQIIREHNQSEVHLHRVIGDVM